MSTLEVVQNEIIILRIPTLTVHLNSEIFLAKFVSFLARLHFLLRFSPPFGPLLYFPRPAGLAKRSSARATLSQNTSK